MKKLIAFTLAEVLIVMGIIGVVAEMTIPGLVIETHKSQGLTGLKKAYTIMNQTLNTMAQDLGCTGDITCIFDSYDNDIMGAKFTKYLKTTKICPYGTAGCFPNIIAIKYDGSSRTSGYSTADVHSYRFITKDGMAFDMANPISGCSGYADLPTGCFLNIYVDVNGLNAPNAFGLDVFYFLITKDKGFIPYGAPGIPAATSEKYYWKNQGSCTSSNKLGYYCGGKIMDEGWRMTY